MTAAYTFPTAAQELAEAQRIQIAALTLACASAIVSGFPSLALGTAHTYPSKPNDQSNLIGCATVSLSPGLPSTWACNFWCADASGNWSYQPHTAAQIQQVLSDGAKQREAYSAQLAKLETQVMLAATPSAVQAIIWSNP